MALCLLYQLSELFLRYLIVGSRFDRHKRL